MAKKKQEDPPMGAPAWMATFSDLMNLLLCFFVLLFAMSSVDEEKWEQVVQSLSNSLSFFNGGQSLMDDGMLVNMGTTQLNQLDEYYTTMGKLSEEEGDIPEEYKEWQEQQDLENLEETSKMLDDLSEKLDENQLSDSEFIDDISIDPGGKYVELLLNGTFLFDSGSAELSKEALPILAKVGAILRIYDNHMINIIGHTDNVPINTYQYPNNNYLSSARAITVESYLSEISKLDEEFLSSTARGEKDPIATNSTPEGRAKNRRIEIRIYNSYNSTMGKGEVKK